MTTENAVESIDKDLRLIDLIAKTSGASLRNTMRVLVAAELILSKTDMGISSVVKGRKFRLRRPTSDEAFSCDRASFALESLASRGDRDTCEALRKLRVLAKKGLDDVGY